MSNQAKADPTYTFFLRGFETIGAISGLTLSQAFRLVTEHAGYWSNFDWNCQPIALALQGRHDEAEIVLTATAQINTDAERELKNLAIDGRLGGFTALPDEEYQERIGQNAA